MKGYLTLSEACSETGMTLYALNNLIGAGIVRVKKTSDIARGNSVKQRYVLLQDILDAQSGLESSYMDISKVYSVYGLTTSAVRDQIKKHRLRWKRRGVHLQVCVSDLEEFFQEAEGKTSGHKKGAMRYSA